MKQKITGFDQDDEQHWRAILMCGHRQHLRHDPPLTTRTWVLTEEGRASRIGFELDMRFDFLGKIVRASSASDHH